MRLFGSNPEEQTLLYAGNPEYPVVLTKYVSDNPSGADNQQERPSPQRSSELQESFNELQLERRVSTRTESSEAIRKAPPLKLEDEDMVHPG